MRAKPTAPNAAPAEESQQQALASAGEGSRQAPTRKNTERQAPRHTQQVAVASAGDVAHGGATQRSAEHAIGATPIAQVAGGAAAHAPAADALGALAATQPVRRVAPRKPGGKATRGQLADSRASAPSAQTTATKLSATLATGPASSHAGRPARQSANAVSTARPATHPRPAMPQAPAPLQPGSAAAATPAPAEQAAAPSAGVSPAADADAAKPAVPPPPVSEDEAAAANDVALLAVGTKRKRGTQKTSNKHHASQRDILAAAQGDVAEDAVPSPSGAAQERNAAGPRTRPQRRRRTPARVIVDDDIQISDDDPADVSSLLPLPDDAGDDGVDVAPAVRRKQAKRQPKRGSAAANPARPRVKQQARKARTVASERKKQAQAKAKAEAAAAAADEGEADSEYESSDDALPESAAALASELGVARTQNRYDMLMKELLPARTERTCPCCM